MTDFILSPLYVNPYVEMGLTSRSPTSLCLWLLAQAAVQHCLFFITDKSAGVSQAAAVYWTIVVVVNIDFVDGNFDSKYVGNISGLFCHQHPYTC